MAFLKDDLQHLYDSISLEPTLEELRAQVNAVLEKAKDKVPDITRKLSWEVCLRNDVLDLAATEGTALQNNSVQYYALVRKKMDVILVMTEQDACDAQFPLTILEDLMETQTIESCSHVFSWMEDRSTRLTKGMEPQKGKALVLLRTLNELLRRLSKTAQTTFCGRILTFLSGAYSLGDRSGVNLRGEYGPLWDEVRLEGLHSSAMDMGASTVQNEGPSAAASYPQEAMAVDAQEQQTIQLPAECADKDKNERKREEFFETFWSLQTFFSRPPLLIQAGAFDKFKDAVDTVLPVISEANKKERLLMGSKNMMGNAGMKRKRDSPMEAVSDYRHDYFFAKFLTSPELLELELADSLFRRQILMQLMITLQFLQLLTKTEKAKWYPPKNRSFLTEFVLEQPETTWVLETWSKTMTEIRATAPHGKEFADAATGTLQRERNWISWKNEHCPSFDKPTHPPLTEAYPLERSERLRPRSDWQWPYGTEELTELFEMGYRNLDDLKNPPRVDDLPILVKRIKQQEKKIELRKKQMEMIAKRRALVSIPTPTPSDQLINGNNIPVLSVPPSNQNEPVKHLPNSTVGTIIKPQTPGVHPLPPKPGTSTSVSKPLASSSSTEKTEVPRPKKVVTPTIPRDPQLEAFETEKRKLSWLALRSAREEYWQLFSAAKGNPEKMMWMLERNKEVMRKWDEDSFAATGWIEGDTTILFSEDRPKGTASKDNKSVEPSEVKAAASPRGQDEGNDSQGRAQSEGGNQERQGSILMAKGEQVDSKISLPEAPQTGEALSDRTAMKVDVSEAVSSQ